MNEIIDTIKNNMNLKEGAAVIERVLEYLYFRQPASTKELSGVSFLPIPVVSAMKKECIKLGIAEQKNGIILSEAGMTYMEEHCGYGGLDKDSYLRLLTDEKAAEMFAEELAAELESLYEGRPQVDVTLDQAKGTALTAVKRALLALKRQTLLGKKILCVGDDDLVSAAIGFLLKKLYRDLSKIKTKVCVLEKDRRYVDYIREITEMNKLPIECVEADLREPFPPRYMGIFDVFYTDPPYTIEGLTLFLSRGIEGLKLAEERNLDDIAGKSHTEKGLKIFLSFGQKPNEEIYRMQQVFLSHGLILTAIYDSFNRYEGASLLGGNSQLFILETTDHTKAVISANASSQDKIYTADRRETNTTYRCRNCKTEIVAGKTREYNTIEKLKGAGCPKCGCKVFDQKRREN